MEIQVNIMQDIHADEMLRHNPSVLRTMILNSLASSLCRVAKTSGGLVNILYGFEEKYTLGIMFCRQQRSCEKRWMKGLSLSLWYVQMVPSD